MSEQVSESEQANEYGLLHEKHDSKIHEEMQEGNVCNKTLLVGEYDMKMRDDTRQCFVCDICVLDNDKIMIADSSNNKLKLLDIEFKVEGSCDIQGQPGVMCRTGSSDVACLACRMDGGHSFVQFVSFDNEALVPANSFIVEKDKFCRGGICYLQQQLFILCSKQEIKVYDFRGSVLHHIFFSDLKGCTVMANIWTDDCDLIVSDGHNKIFILDTNGKRKAKITDKRFHGIYGLSARTCGQIIFTSYYANSIFTMDTKGKCKQEILGSTEGIKHPQAVAYMKSSNCIIIGSYCTDNIQLYTLPQY